MVEKIKQALERAYSERANLKTPISELLTSAKHYQIDLDQLFDNRIVTLQSDSRIAESYNLLGAKLRSKLDTEKFISLGITSANPGEGKTVTAINIALNQAKIAEQNVILIDGDLVHPSIQRELNMQSKYGLIDLLDENIDLLDENIELTEIIFRTNIPKLWVIPGRFEKDLSSEQPSLNKMNTLIESLADGDRNILIVDLPPVLGNDDTLAITTHLDATILVVENGKTKADEVSRSVALLKQANLIGCVLNKANSFK